MGSRSKRKGKVGELEAAAALRDVLHVEATRGRQFSGATDSPDVRHSIPGVHIEVKRCERLNLRDAVQQAAADAGESVPVVMHRYNRGEWVWIVPFNRVPELATQLYLTLAGES